MSNLYGTGRAARSAPVCTEAEREQRPFNDPITESATWPLSDTTWLGLVQSFAPWELSFSGYQGSWE